MNIKKQLPARARVEQLKKQAKELLIDARAGDASAVDRIRFVVPRAAATPEKLRLADAQLIVAREYGFDSWSKLKHKVETIDLADQARSVALGRTGPHRSALARERREREHRFLFAGSRA